MKQIIFWLIAILELSGLLFGVVAAISFVAGLICWVITGNEHSIFEEFFEFCINGIKIYGIWFVLSGLIAMAMLSKK